MDLIFIADDIENLEEGNIPEEQGVNLTENEIPFPSPLFATAEELQELKKPSVHKINHWIPGLHEKYVSRWQQLNELFLNHYPGEIERKVHKEESLFSTHNLRKDYQEKHDKINWSKPDASLLQELDLLRDRIREIEKLPPAGYIAFLKESEYVSPTMERMIIEDPDFFQKFPLSYLSDDYALCERLLSLVDFTFKLKEYQDFDNRKHKSLYKTLVTDKSDFLKLKIGTENLPIEKFWAPMVIDSIFKELELFWEEQSNNMGFDIDLWTQSSSEVKTHIREFMAQIKMQGENEQAYLVGNLIDILKWPEAKAGGVTTDSAEFIFRVLKIFGLDEGRIKEIDAAFADAKKDNDNRPIKGSSYHRRRNEVFQRCRVIKNTYDKLTSSRDTSRNKTH